MITEPSVVSKILNSTSTTYIVEIKPWFPSTADCKQMWLDLALEIQWIWEASSKSWTTLCDLPPFPAFSELILKIAFKVNSYVRLW